jgi:hypothetical protein
LGAQRRFSLATTCSDHLGAPIIYGGLTDLNANRAVPTLRANSTKTCTPITTIFLERQTHAMQRKAITKQKLN